MKTARIRLPLALIASLCVASIVPGTALASGWQTCGKTSWTDLRTGTTYYYSTPVFLDQSSWHEYISHTQPNTYVGAQSQMTVYPINACTADGIGHNGATMALGANIQQDPNLTAPNKGFVQLGMERESGGNVQWVFTAEDGNWAHWPGTLWTFTGLPIVWGHVYLTSIRALNVGSDPSWNYETTDLNTGNYYQLLTQRNWNLTNHGHKVGNHASGDAAWYGWETYNLNDMLGASYTNNAGKIATPKYKSSLSGAWIYEPNTIYFCIDGVSTPNPYECLEGSSYIEGFTVNR